MRIALARRKAEELLRELRMDRVPVDVEVVARRLRLAVIKSDLGPDTSGLLVTDESGTRICLSSTDLPRRRRFTLAHEIGHHCLGHQFPRGEHVHVDRGNFISQRGRSAAPGIDPKEVEANQFAASLLMPAHLLRRHAQLLAGRGPLHDGHVSKLADTFQVSEQAMAIRLASLDLP